MLFRIALLALLMPGCFDPLYRCDEGEACPAGRVCVRGACVFLERDGSLADSEAPQDTPQADLGLTDLPADQGTLSDEGRDASPPEDRPSPDLAADTMMDILDSQDAPADFAPPPEDSAPDLFTPPDMALLDGCSSAPSEACVPSGPFTMGSLDRDDEMPPHTVWLTAFSIDLTEVTNDQYRQCVDSGACSAPELIEAYEDPKRDSHPVVGVTWEQATLYCAWQGKRLPTEAEWERAARSKGLYPWGEGVSCDHAVYRGCGALDDTAPVGSKPLGASPGGALDMAGNAREMVSDWYSPAAYDACSAGCLDPFGPATGTRRVTRGGSYKDEEGALRSTARSFTDPAVAQETVGFRCAHQ